ncbi:MAG TPA: hypothetical protein VFB21_03665 [Chthonomonadaceae bacterium]|nr:hypothetical protein [Chthonomonadaceae bacterium]
MKEGDQMVFDFDAEMEAGQKEVTARAEMPQTRCYTLTGAPSVLDSLEAALRRIEWIGEQGVTRLVSVFVDGAGGAKVAVRVLASWMEEDESGEKGAPLRRLADEERIAAHYLHDVPSCPLLCPGRVFVEEVREYGCGVQEEGSGTEGRGEDRGGGDSDLGGVPERRAG